MSRCETPMKSTAPSTATGTLIRIASGSPHDSYRAASARNTKTSASR